MKAFATFLLVGVLASLGLAFVVTLELSSAKLEPQLEELAYRRGSFALRFTEEPCPYDEIAEQLNNEGIPPAKAYRELLADGRWALPGCWVRDISNDVMTLTSADQETKTIAKEWLIPPQTAPSSR